MKTALCLLSMIAFLIVVLHRDVLAQEQEYIYAGTFTERGSLGIYIFQFDKSTGKMKLVQTVPGKDSPSFLALNRKQTRLYAVYREGTREKPDEGTVMAYSVDQNDGRLNKMNEVASGGAGPCHISVDPKNRYVYISHYADGTFSTISLSKDGALVGITDIARHSGSSVNPNRQEGPHVHSAVPSENGKHIYVADLGTDKVIQYGIDDGSGKLAQHSETSVQPGAGPRHFTLHPDGRSAYLAEELSSTVSCYAVEKKTGELLFLQRLSTLPDGYTETNSVADIHTDPEGRFLYVSNRGHNSLAIYSIDASTGKLIYIDNVHVKGKRPRNFMVHPNGQFVFVANRDSDEITVFKRNSETGTMVFTGQRVAAPGVVCLKMAALR
jgi:6-phosphogluconolactonase